MKKGQSDRDEAEKTPLIVFSHYSPYMAVDVDKLTGPDGGELPLEAVTSLCRCGGSERKPYCDGTHGKIGFDGTPDKKRPPGRRKDYVGKYITIHDNRRVCSHAAECLNGLPAVFDREADPWIDPDGADVAAIMTVIERCPSGALSYTVHGEHHGEWGDATPAIKVEEGGPLRCTGCIAIKDPDHSTPEAKSHYTLCRCGQSANKPFCDGTHLDVDFE